VQSLLDKAKTQKMKAEITIIDTEITPLRYESSLLMDSNTRTIQECALRVIDNGRLGAVQSTGSTDVEDVWSAVELATKYGEKLDLEFPVESVTSTEYLDPILEEITPSEQRAWCENVLAMMKEKNPEVPVDLTLTRQIQNLQIKNTLGLDSSFKKSAWKVWLQGRVPGSKVGIIKESASHKFHDMPEVLLDELAEEFRCLSKTSTVKSGKMKVLFSSAAAWSLIYRFYAACNGDNVQRGISPLREKLGEKILPDNVNLYDDPFFANGVDARPFDDEGVLVTKKPVIESGRLMNFLYDLKTGARTGQGSTGNGFRKATWVEGIQFAPNPQFASMVMYPGKTTREEMVQSMDEGIIVD
jgi:PmbA protein